MATQSTQQFNPDSYARAWEDFAASESEPYDIVIIGGGSVGAGAAVDAATRGLKTAVIEAGDYAGGTSSRSSKMFHGGLRYLAMFDFKLVAESLHERELNMSTLAPHLVKPLKFIFPLTHRMWERVMMFAGFTLYDLMGGAKSVPHQKHLTRAAAAAIAGFVAPHLGWDEAAQAAEVEQFNARIDAELAAEKALTDRQANDIIKQVSGPYERSV